MKKILLTLAALLMVTGCQMKASNDISKKPKLNRTIWNVEGKTDEEINERVKHLVKISDPRTKEERARDQEVKERYKDAIVVDGLVVGGVNSTGKGFAGMTKEQFDELINLQAKDYDLYSTTISNGTDKSVDEVYDRAKETKRIITDKHGHKFVDSVDEIRANKVNGETSFVMNFQAIDHLGCDHEKHISQFEKEGVKVMSFSYNLSNMFTGSGDTNSLPSGPKGLTEEGIKAVKVMNEAGVVVDVSHDSDQTAIDAAKYSTKPIIASHSNPRALMDIDRNISDEAILAIAKTGGTIGINFLGGFLNKEGLAGPEDIAKHVVYVADLIEKKLKIDGKKHVTIGGDYVHNFEDALHWVIRNPKKFPPSSGFAQETEMGLPGDIWGVVRVLEEDYNWTHEEVTWFLGENLLRVYKANWK